MLVLWRVWMSSSRILLGRLLSLCEVEIIRFSEALSEDWKGKSPTGQVKTDTEIRVGNFCQ